MPATTGCNAENTRVSQGDDWFYLSERSEFFFPCGTAPSARLIDTAGAAEHCYFIAPYDGFVPTCLAPFTPATEGPADYQGCCGVNEVQVRYEGWDAEVLVRLLAAVDACVPYTTRYRY